MLVQSIIIQMQKFSTSFHAVALLPRMRSVALL